jgi:hypothetical protein
MQTCWIQRSMDTLEEVSNSNCFVTFRSLVRRVIDSLVQAENIALYIQPFLSIIRTFDHLQHIASFTLQFDRLFHTLALTWSNSMYYTNIKRFIAFIQQWTNFIVIKVDRIVGE